MRFRLHFLAGLRVVLAFTALTGVLYPLAVTACANVAFPDQASGSLVRRGGAVVGSKLIGQNFTQERYFQPRPSAAGRGYDGRSSSGSNLGPTNDGFLATVAARVEAYRRDNGLSSDAPVPVDAVTASGSGLDPHISVANARLQVGRIARARKLDPGTVLALIASSIDGRGFAVLGEDGVNVLAANLALDALRPGG
jgi:K+-transporting ATPase ATPase C chain